MKLISQYERTLVQVKMEMWQGKKTMRVLSLTKTVVRQYRLAVSARR